LPQGWGSECETFAGVDDETQLFQVVYRPEPPTGPRALLILHGMNEHGGRYLHFPHYLQGVVDCVVCVDHRGHGRSSGLRGHVERFDSFADDAKLALERLDRSLRERFGRSEIHLLGHSMGGLVALRMLFRHSDLPLASVTLSAPLLAVKLKVPAHKHAAAKLLSRVWGSLQLSTEVRGEDLSHDPEVVEAYRLDRLNHRKATPRLYTGMLEALSDTLGRNSGIPVPVQFQVPLDDKVVDAEVTLGFFRALKHEEKRLKTYPGFYHEAFNELGKEQVFGDLVEWIKKHSRAA
jgi:alpha-beta hydrolase superfamily lysophospholipase